MDEDLLIKFLTNACSADELGQVDAWISADKANAEWLFEIERIWSYHDELHYSDRRQIKKAWHRFITVQKRKKNAGKKSLSLPTLLKYSAAAIIVILLAFNIYRTYDDHRRPTPLNTVVVPKGERASVILSDGTKVILNSESRLIYPAEFKSKTRQVTLLGEGYFEVAHDNSKPFTVKSEIVHVTVLGTKFNFRAYSNEKAIVTLAEGCIEVGSNTDENKLILHPNEQVTYSKSEGWMLTRHVNVAITKYWIEGESAYLNQSLGEICQDLQRRFDVTIKITDRQLAADKFSCRFTKSDSIIDIMNLLRETRRLDYSIIGNRITIKPVMPMNTK